MGGKRGKKNQNEENSLFNLKMGWRGRWGRLLRGFAPEAGKGVNVYISYLWDQ